MGDDAIPGQMVYCEYADGTSWFEEPGPCPPDYQGFGLVRQETSGQFTLPVEVIDSVLPIEAMESETGVPWATLGLLAIAGLFLLMSQGSR